MTPTTLTQFKDKDELIGPERSDRFEKKLRVYLESRKTRHEVSENSS